MWIPCKCPIWGTDAKRHELGARDSNLFDSPRAGGTFELTRSAEAILRHFDTYTSVELSRLVLQANLNSSRLVISAKEIEQARNAQPLSISERFNTFLRAARECQYNGYFLDAATLEFMIDPRLMAAICSSDRDVELSKIEPYLERAVKRGFVTEVSRRTFRLTLDGEEFVETLSLSPFLHSSIFVAMWFGSSEVKQYFDLAVKPAIEGAGYHCVRIDEVAHNDRIDEMILAEIRKSRAVFADVTCGLAQPLAKPSLWSSSQEVGAPRGGVYFEAGFASGFGIPVIWSVQDSLASVENVVHFDIRQYNQIRWSENHDENKAFIQARIEATLGRGALQKS